MKVITFSKQYPAKHPNAGHKTFFVEKIVRGLHHQGVRPFDVNCEFSEEAYYIVDPKHHTIRAGKRWKVGEWFSPRIWSGKPYASKQIEFAPPIQIKKIWEVCLNVTASEGFNWWIDGNVIPTDKVVELAKNDGLEINDFLNWFMCHPKAKKEGFFGQILCWNESIDYIQNKTNDDSSTSASPQNLPAPSQEWKERFEKELGAFRYEYCTDQNHWELNPDDFLNAGAEWAMNWIEKNTNG
jgi:hypothetical protein